MFIKYNEWMESQKDSLLKRAEKKADELTEMECGYCEGEGEIDCCECGSMKECDICDGQGVIEVTTAELKDFKARFTVGEYLKQIATDVRLFCEWTGRDLEEFLTLHGFDFEVGKDSILIRGFKGSGINANSSALIKITDKQL